ncbi:MULTISPECIES: hypothetical protein [unclassified Phenylobacterium]|uniref:hypothetical protein n=1 Tax=unclassified Phenylobacterium TaxID=2640670 RepID=UPI00083B2689|nr:MULTISPECIES: hypothetical protein [unclassified Phenylobacterium]
MDRRLKLLMVVAAVAATPVSALAQAWPATVVASAPQMRSQPRVPALNLDRSATSLRSTPSVVSRAARKPLKLDATIDPGDAPEIDVQAKDAWTDDQGFRLGPTKLAFKRRF